MYIRRTSTRNTLTGERYFTHRLVCSARVEGKVKQRTLLNLGRHFELDQAHWPLLCARIEQLLSPQPSLLECVCPPAIERQAQYCVAQLLAQQPKATDQDAPPPSEANNDQAPIEVEAVQVDSIQMIRPRTVAVEAMGLWAMQQVDFVGLLKDLGLGTRQRACALGQIIARMAAPGSERATYHWLGQHSALGELLDFDYEALPQMALYRISDQLLKQRHLIESQLFGRVQSLFGLEETVTLYDLSNTYFEGELNTCGKARYGRSKDKRSDCPLVTLGLVLDGSGFVRRSEVFEGSVREGKTLASMLAGLAAPVGALVIMDRGIATEENLIWLREQGYRYLVVSRERARQFDPQAMITLQTATGHPLHLQKVSAADGKDVRLYCYSAQRSAKEQAMQQRFVAKFEAGLQALHEGLSKPRCQKRIDKLWERIGRLKAQSHGVAQHYQIDIVAATDGHTAQAIQWKQVACPGSMLTHPGVYCLRSSETDWDEERLWRTYSMLTDLEAVFRSLKSELGLRPVYHRKEERVEGHLFITVLAYQFVQIIRRRLQEKGYTLSWNSLRSMMSSQCRITATFCQADGRSLHVRKASRAEPRQQSIYDALGIPSAPGGIKKMRI